MLDQSVHLTEPNASQSGAIPVWNLNSTDCGVATSLSTLSGMPRPVIGFSTRLSIVPSRSYLTSD
ncbi:hypothetical protein DK59_3007 [Brucella abortus bv. 4 str. 292]|nr:hypothetical protein DK59_3007 [Brucella abortus bv. 4 str. 292]